MKRADRRNMLFDFTILPFPNQSIFSTIIDAVWKNSCCFWSNNHFFRLYWRWIGKKRKWKMICQDKSLNKEKEKKIKKDECRFLLEWNVFFICVSCLETETRSSMFLKFFLNGSVKLVSEIFLPWPILQKKEHFDGKNVLKWSRIDQTAVQNF